MLGNSQSQFSAVVKKVAIIGAGPGGLAVAIALRKYGIDAQVDEKANALRPVGAGLSLHPNGLNSLEAIAPGMADALKRSGSQTHKMNLKKNTKEIIGENLVPLTEKYGQPLLQIRWSSLQEILASAVGNRALDIKNEVFLHESLNLAQVSQSEFDDWLYNPRPCIVNEQKSL